MPLSCLACVAPLTLISAFCVIFTSYISISAIGLPRCITNLVGAQSNPHVNDRNLQMVHHAPSNDPPTLTTRQPRRQEMFNIDDAAMHARSRRECPKQQLQQSHLVFLAERFGWSRKPLPSENDTAQARALRGPCSCPLSNAQNIDVSLHFDDKAYDQV